MATAAAAAVLAQHPLWNRPKPSIVRLFHPVLETWNRCQVCGRTGMSAGHSICDMCWPAYLNDRVPPEWLRGDWRFVVSWGERQVVWSTPFVGGFADVRSWSGTLTLNEFSGARGLHLLLGVKWPPVNVDCWSLAELRSSMVHDGQFVVFNLGEEMTEATIAKAWREYKEDYGSHRWRTRADLVLPHEYVSAWPDQIRNALTLPSAVSTATGMTYDICVLVGQYCYPAGSSEYLKRANRMTELSARAADMMNNARTKAGALYREWRLLVNAQMAAESEFARDDERIQNLAGRETFCDELRRSFPANATRLANRIPLGLKAYDEAQAKKANRKKKKTGVVKTSRTPPRASAAAVTATAAAAAGAAGAAAASPVDGDCENPACRCKRRRLS